MSEVQVRAFTAGVVAVVQKREGDPVQANEAVVIIECMKVQIPIPSPRSGQVIRIHVKVDDMIEEDQVVFTVAG